jgi:hypothetical protein
MAAGGGRADTPAGGGQAGATLCMGMHACTMHYGGREDTEGAPMRRQGRCINIDKKCLCSMMRAPCSPKHFRTLLDY